MAMERNENDLLQGIVRCGDAAWALGALTRTLDPDELPPYTETCFSCVTCAYYQQRCCGNPDKLPKLWQGEERIHVRGQKHTIAARSVATSVPQMTEWLDKQNERLGMAPPGPGAAPAAAESPVAASSAPPSVCSQERLQALEEAVYTLQGQCAELLRRNEDLDRRINEMTATDERATYYNKWW